jgi:hypothetical protein
MLWYDHAIKQHVTTPSYTTSTQVQPTSSPTRVFDGPITRSQAKKLQQEVHQEEGQNISKANQQEELRPSQSSVTELSRRNSHNFWFPKDMKAHKYFLERSWSLVSNASTADVTTSTSKAADLL